MKWQDCAIQDLKKYNQQRESLQNIPERIEILKLRFEAVKAVALDREPVMGGGSRMEDAILDNIVQRDRLKLTYQANKKMVELVEKGLAVLTDNERMVLDAFYINRHRNHIEYLCDRMGYEKTKIYHIKDDALYRFTTAMYGILEY